MVLILRDNADGKSEIKLSTQHLGGPVCGDVWGRILHIFKQAPALGQFKPGSWGDSIVSVAAEIENSQGPTSVKPVIDLMLKRLSCQLT